MAKQLRTLPESPTEARVAVFAAVLMSFVLGIYVGYNYIAPTAPPENCQYHIATVPARAGEPVQRWQVTTCQVKL